MQMEVEEEKQHEGIQQYYITKIEALQVLIIHDDLCICHKGLKNLAKRRRK